MCCVGNKGKSNILPSNLIQAVIITTAVWCFVHMGFKYVKEITLEDGQVCSVILNIHIYVNMWHYMVNNAGFVPVVRTDKQLWKNLAESDFRIPSTVLVCHMDSPSYSAVCLLRISIISISLMVNHNLKRKKKKWKIEADWVNISISCPVET